MRLLSSPFDSLVDEAPKQSFADFFLWLHDHASPDEMSMLCSSLWACWLGRNKKDMENVDCDMGKLVAGMVKMVGDYQEYAHKVFSVSLPKVPVFKSWKPPDEG